ncbi:MAG: class I SAM-dependent methyltransferase [Dysgonamonadaceae bacterium]|nr:class I SAM-dependent methyltransferase [Dysgonamonadaceae bacterium]
MWKQVIEIANESNLLTYKIYKKMNKVSSGNDYVHGVTAPLTSQFLHEPIGQIMQNIQAKKVLDIGCGNGHLAKYLKINIIHSDGVIVGMDPSESGIENAQLLLPDAKFYCMGVYDNPCKIEENNFDAVVSTEVVEHLFYPRELLRFAKAKLKPGGYILLTTPYHGYLKNLVLSIFNKWDNHHWALWDGGHIKFWSKKTLSDLLNVEGFEFKEFVGCGRVPYLWKSMLLVGKLR